MSSSDTDHVTARGLLTWTVFSFLCIIACFGYMRVERTSDDDLIFQLCANISVMAAVGQLMLCFVTVLKMIFDREAEKWLLFMALAIQLPIVYFIIMGTKTG